MGRDIVLNSKIHKMMGIYKIEDYSLLIYLFSETTYELFIVNSIKYF